MFYKNLSSDASGALVRMASRCFAFRAKRRVCSSANELLLKPRHIAAHRSSCGLKEILSRVENVLMKMAENPSGDGRISREGQK